MKALESLGYMKPNHYKEYIIFNYIKSKYYRFLKLAVSVVYSVASLALIVCGFIYNNEAMRWLAVAMLVFCALFIYTVNRNVKAICKANPKLLRSVQHVKFGKNGFVFNLICKTESENEHYEVTFDQLQKIYDTPKAFYVYVNKRSVVIIPKEYLCCSIEEARNYLKSYCPPDKLSVCI